MLDEILRHRIISFVGSGGKTTLMLAVARKLSQLGKKVIVTTSTRVYVPQELRTVLPEEDTCHMEATEREALKRFMVSEIGFSLMTDNVCVTGSRCPSGSDFEPPKICSYELCGLNAMDLLRLCDFVLVEADGSKHMPLKFPGENEPVIPIDSDMVIAVAGMWCTGHPLSEVCHRYELACRFLSEHYRRDISADHIVTKEDVMLIMDSEQGYRKNVGNRKFMKYIFSSKDDYSDFEITEEIMNKNTGISDFYRKIISESAESRKNAFLLTLTGDENTASKALAHMDRDGIMTLDMVENQELEAYWKNLIKKISTERPDYSDGIDSVFIERLNPGVQVVLCGGGHVSLAISKLCRFMNYDFIVLEDREEFGNRDRFPDAADIIVGDFDSIFRNNSFEPNACFVIATRGHSHDALCLENVMTLEFLYAGMIGSRTKVQKTKKLMLSKGFTEDDFECIHTPIGLPIGGQTPEEIAVSIIAEIIQTVNRQALSYFSGAIKNAVKSSDSPVVLAKIISKKGSSPRGTGSQMIIRKDGSTADTIGGGTIEYMCIKEAVRLLSEDDPKPFVKNFVLSNDQARGIGMWCGGVIDVLFDII